MPDDKYEFASFEQFWPFYLSEHLNATSRAWHFAGITAGIVIGIALLATGYWYLVPLSVIPGYLFAWVGHFGYEKNIPASFAHPWLSLRGDLTMYWRTLIGRLSQDYRTHHLEIQRFADAARRRKEDRTAGKAASSETA